MVTTLALSGVFSSAADLIEKRGKASSRFIDQSVHPCPLCPLGALALACGLPPDAASTVEVLAFLGMDAPARLFEGACDALLLHLGHPGLEETSWSEVVEKIGRWSDEHTDEQVVTALRDCASELQEAAR
jgi:hypothetical protein